MVGCTFIFQLSISAFSGSVKGALSLGKERLLIKELKGRIRIPPTPLLTETGTMADLACLGP